jgi:ribulose-phosphate 3-epimerase
VSTPRRALRLAPSLLSADFANLDAGIRACVAAGADAFHLDVMDGHFVPNISFGPALVAAVRARTDLPLDIHLMIEHPIRYAGAFAKAGGSTLVFHLESSDDPAATVRAVRDLGVAVGAAVKPGTPFERLAPLLDSLDQVLVMSVEPGFSGQSFLPAALPKLASARSALRAIGSRADISIDGGVTVTTAPLAARAGASFFVCGNSVFVGGRGVAGNLADLRAAVARGVADAVP